jgi:sugar phosphate isomerase/epimerase
MPAIGIENISVFGMPPVEFVQLANALGCQHISTGLTGFAFGVHDYPIYSLRDDAPLRREMIAAMRDTGVSISLGEGCTIRAGGRARDYAHDLDLFAELGTPRINTVSMDPDFTRTCDEFAGLAEMCATRGLRITTELAPSLTIKDLPTALAALKHIGRPEFRLLIDTMHITRSGSRPADIAALDPALIDYVQICDAPRVPAITSYFEESMFERMVPGEGELGLRDWLRVLPKDRVYALEVPQRSAALAGKNAHERLGACVAGLRKLFAETYGEEIA